MLLVVVERPQLISLDSHGPHILVVITSPRMILSSLGSHPTSFKYPPNILDAPSFYHRPSFWHPLSFCQAPIVLYIFLHFLFSMRH
jgi:hypothetical protein